MISKKVLIILFALTFLGGFLRLYKLDKNPVGLNVDEISIGYNAYAILKTGKDEYGKFLPLTFKSLGDFKPPLYVYLTVPSIAVFGLNEFSIRFPSAILATLAIPLFYLFLLSLIKDKRYALAGAALLTISPWHIYFSRLASETSVATTLTILGIFCLLKLKKQSWVWSPVAAFFLSLPMYTYHSSRLFIPFFILVFLLANHKKFLLQRTKIISFLLFLAIFLIPLCLSFILGDDATRLKMTIITSDINLSRYILLERIFPPPGLPGIIVNLFSEEYLLLFFFWARKFLAYFQPSFLFINGLDMTATGTYGLGVMYLFEVPFLVMGIFTLFRKKIENKDLIIYWILLGIFPASLTLSEQQPFRSLVILPMLVLLSAIGAVELFKKISKSRLTVLLMILLIVWNLMQAILIYTIHFPKERGEYFMEGTREAVNYVLNHGSKYKEIVFDPYRGNDDPSVVSVPHLYILFYAKYDPKTYQEENKTKKDGVFSFDKFTIRKIDWPKDKLKKDTLFIGSLWSFSEKELKTGELLEKIYLSNGNVAFQISSPRAD